ADQAEAQGGEDAEVLLARLDEPCERADDEACYQESNHSPTIGRWRPRSHASPPERRDELVGGPGGAAPDRRGPRPPRGDGAAATRLRRPTGRRGRARLRQWSQPRLPRPGRHLG